MDFFMSLLLIVSELPQRPAKGRGVSARRHADRQPNGNRPWICSSLVASEISWFFNLFLARSIGLDTYGRIKREGHGIMAAMFVCKVCLWSRTFRLHSPPGGGCLGQSGHSPDGKHSLPTSNGELSFPDSSPHALSDVCGQGGSLGATAELYYEFQSTISSISVGKQLKDLSCDFVILSRIYSSSYLPSSHQCWIVSIRLLLIAARVASPYADLRLPWHGRASSASFSSCRERPIIPMEGSLLTCMDFETIPGSDPLNLTSKRHDYQHMARTTLRSPCRQECLWFSSVISGWPPNFQTQRDIKCKLSEESWKEWTLAARLLRFGVRFPNLLILKLQKGRCSILGSPLWPMNLASFDTSAKTNSPE